jgi:DMSO/TMAO reductase YedYZ molybdopterin-dependent catalytic subunit
MEYTTQRKKDERRLAQEGRLPPGQSLTYKFPVLHYGRVPEFDPGAWKFRVWGEVEYDLTWTWDEFNSLPRTSVVMDIHCVTRWSKFDTVWEGVSVRTLVEQGIISIGQEAKFVVQHAENEYTTNLPLEVVLSDNFLMATHFEGKPISPEHGYPLRGVVGHIPDRGELKVPYFWKGAKWLRGLEFLKIDSPGFWEQAGYHNEGDVWKEERFRER